MGASFRASFRVGLGDPVYTVRWLAVRALAGLGDVDGLEAVLAESRPRTERDDYAHAVAALGESGRREVE